VARELARLHERVLRVDDPNGWLDRPTLDDPLPILEGLTAAGAVDASTARELAAAIEPLRALAGTGPQRFLHNDVHFMNVLFDAGRPWLLDWGDAGFGDPALEFESMPFDAIPTIVAEYRALAPPDDSFEERVALAQFAGALSKLSNGRPKRFASLLRWRRAGLPGRWRSLMGA
jgi:aminoglycoside phosphotransferase (APT) family kinase protein